MIGFVDLNLRPLLRLVVLGDEQSRERDVIVDTGFNGYLTLHRTIIEALNLPFINLREIKLADGSILEMPAYQGRIIWSGTECLIEILATDGDDLLGAALLKDHELHIEVRDGGAVEINPLTN